MTLNIATHNKIFHADEVTAVALLKLFTTNEIVVHREDHDTTDLSSYDMIIDIGKKFDGIKYFDHHQYKGGKSSAGLIWDYLGLEEDYVKISKLIKLVDENDTGIKKAKPFEYTNMIKCYNSKNISSEEQDVQFHKAVDFAYTILKSMAEYQDIFIEAKEIINNSYMFNNNKNIIELSAFTPHWASYINWQKTPNIKVVVWEDKDENNWKARIAPKKLGSFELNGNELKPDETMKFVHSSGHFAIAKDKDTLKSFLDKQNI